MMSDAIFVKGDNRCYNDKELLMSDVVKHKKVMSDAVLA
jgi:hypothetical protein